MTREGSRKSWSSARLVARALARVFAKSISVGLVTVTFGLASAAPAAAEPVKGQATLTKGGDYARLVVKLHRQVDAEVRTSGMIVVVKFVRPIDVPVDKLWEGAPDFVSSARVDPDGSATPPGAGAQGHTERHGGGRAPVHRPVARYLERPAAIVAAGRHQGTGRAREGGRAAAAAVRSGTRHQETPADPRARVHAADVYALRVRAARWRRRLDHPQQGTADAELRFRPDVRPCRREGRHRAEHLRHHPEGRRREHGRRVRAARRCRRAFLPRGAELRGRHRLRREAGEPAEA